jgi:hypothetical protein
MVYYFKDKHRLSEVKLEFKGQNCMFNSYEMELYSVGTQRVQMKGVPPWLVRWLVVPVHEIFFCLGCSSQPSTNIFPHCTLFQFLCPHRPTSWAGSRAGSPVS